MGIQRRDRGRATAEPAWLAGGTVLHIAGESFTPEAVDVARRGLPGNVSAGAVLVPDSSNSHDPHSVAVLVQGHRAGWLSRHITPVMEPALKAYAASHGGQLVSCPARLADLPGAPQILLFLDLAPLGVDPAELEYVPELHRVIQRLLPMLAEPVPAMTGQDDHARQLLAAAERDRAATGQGYARPPEHWLGVEKAFREAAARLEAACDPLVSDACLGVARATRHQRGRRDATLMAVIEALRWNIHNAAAWGLLVDVAASAPHVSTLVTLFGKVPVEQRPPVLRQLFAVSRAEDRVGSLSAPAGQRLCAQLLVLARSEGDDETVQKLLQGHPVPRPAVANCSDLRADRALDDRRGGHRDRSAGRSPATARNPDEVRGAGAVERVQLVLRVPRPPRGRHHDPGDLATIEDNAVD